MDNKEVGWLKAELQRVRNRANDMECLIACLLEFHEPVGTGYCSICRHYGADCLAARARDFIDGEVETWKRTETEPDGKEQP